MTNVVTILGSPRPKSDSSRLADAAASILSGGAGASARHVINSFRNVRGCQACQSCKGKTDSCVVKDDMAPVLTTCAAADVIVLASPIYIGEITAQLKLFVDRTYSWFMPDFHSNPAPGRLKGKKALLVFTQGNPDGSTYERIFEAYKAYFTRQGFSTEYRCVVVPYGPDHDRAVEAAEAEIRKLAASLL
ncbi:MAG: flavodoxin family protein [Deltaproteobacteria bacterium]|jgi:multimeric flavodoxin WrbA|nr:flavodoxin family protein [Deltaproteobacteria bacterium]